MRPSAGLVILFALSGLPVRAGALPDSGASPAAEPAARELGRAFAALTQPPAGRTPQRPDAGCHFRKRWSKPELLALSGKLSAPQRLILLQHFSDDGFLASAGILLNAGQICDCPPAPTLTTDIGVSKSAAPTTVLAGSPLTYTLRVDNFDFTTASSVSLTDPLPAALTFSSSTPGSPTCSMTGSTFNCTLGNMTGGASQTVTLNVTVSPTAPGGSLANTASVTTATPDTYAPNNSQTATVTVIPLQPGRVPDTLLLKKNAGNGSLLDLSWTASCGNTVTGYGVYQGTLGTFYSHAPLNSLCAVAGLAVTAQPTAAVSSYYLIVPQSSSMEGSYGVDSSGLELPPSGAPCQATQAFGGVCP